MAEERRPIPHLTSRGRWSQYIAGIFAETAYVAMLCIVGFAIACAAVWMAR